MKNYLRITFVAILIVITSTFINCQEYGFIPVDGKIIWKKIDCGTWVEAEIIYTDWKVTDTINKNPIQTTNRLWEYSDFQIDDWNCCFLVYCPCGCGDETSWDQYRVCKITGIVEHRRKTQKLKYIPKTSNKSEYQTIIDSLSK